MDCFPKGLRKMSPGNLYTFAAYLGTDLMLVLHFVNCHFLLIVDVFYQPRWHFSIVKNNLRQNKNWKLSGLTRKWKTLRLSVSAHITWTAEDDQAGHEDTLFPLHWSVLPCEVQLECLSPTIFLYLIFTSLFIRDSKNSSHLNGCFFANWIVQSLLSIRFPSHVSIASSDYQD